MTREEAIQQLNIEKDSLRRLVIDCGITELKPKFVSISMAIEALLILGEDGIVNCCGCIHWNEYGFCNLTDRRKGDFDYCSDGRREP